MKLQKVFSFPLKEFEIFTNALSTRQLGLETTKRNVGDANRRVSNSTAYHVLQVNNDKRHVGLCQQLTCWTGPSLVSAAATCRPTVLLKVTSAILFFISTTAARSFRGHWRYVIDTLITTCQYSLMLFVKLFFCCSIHKLNWVLCVRK